ncbi:hypothetical protein [Solitalea koreensis]|uniref:Outer membrane protein n=1 Tax=Solitalea koreensis TaxID=543615 RepID=A0A521BG06_9SPHI|nr:hypothetical protein [Solitalea koreensis]SMO46044.1 hypothetical protein SAMN06265350_102170 [Solitalea koreensis]
MKYLYLSILLCIASIKCFGQADSSKTTLTLAAIYSTNANYYGQVSEEKLPYLLTNATLRLPFGLYFSGSAYRLLNTTGGSVVSAGELGTGLDITMSKSVTSTISFSHAFFPTNSPMLKAGNNNSLSASLNYAWWLTTALNADYIFGGDSNSKDVFVTFSTSKQIGLGSITQSDQITLSPAIDVIGGTQQFYETYMTKKEKGLFGKIIPPIIPSGGDKTTTRSYTDFNLMSYNLKLPLAYNRSNYVIEAAFQQSVLAENAKPSFEHSSSFFNMSFYYQF